MPITPFHFGPGALLKVVAPKQVSWTTFALANCLIDLEPIVHYLLSGDPAHRFFHTFPGATLLGLIAVWPGRRLCETCLRAWNRQLDLRQQRWLGTGTRIPTPAALTGALTGAWSHLLLDSAMHVDVLALWPRLDSNPWHGWIGLDLRHWLCVGAGVAALAPWLTGRLRS